MIFFCSRALFALTLSDLYLFCPNSALRRSGTSKDLSVRFTPRQLAADPGNLFFVSGVAARIEFSDSLDQWQLSDAGSNVTARSSASRSSCFLMFLCSYSQVLLCSRQVQLDLSRGLKMSCHGISVEADGLS